MIAVYPGSFDPVTNGHVDIIRRIQPLYNELHVLVADSREKSYLFSLEERVSMLKQSVQDLKNIKVAGSPGLTVSYAQKVGARVIVRGIRAVSDFEFEMTMAGLNRRMEPGIETIIVFASSQFGDLSSRFIKEIALNGGPLAGMVPPVVENELRKKFEK